MFVFINLQGALTSKIYEFKARNWELKSTFGFDIFNTEGLSIVFEYRNAEILRVIPRYSLFNSVWITDKLRFFYTKLKYNRLLRSFYNSYNKLWEVVNKRSLHFMFAWIFVLFYKCFNLKSKFIGFSKNLALVLSKFSIDFIDMQLYLYLQLISCKFFKKGSVYKLYDFVDFRNYILDVNVLTIYKKLVCVGIILRLEFPYFETKLREKVLFNDFKVFFFWL